MVFMLSPAHRRPKHPRFLPCLLQDHYLTLHLSRMSLDHCSTSTPWVIYQLARLGHVTTSISREPDGEPWIIITCRALAKNPIFHVLRYQQEVDCSYGASSESFGNMYTYMGRLVPPRAARTLSPPQIPKPNAM